MKREREGAKFLDYDIKLSLEPYSARFRDPEPWILEETLQSGSTGSVRPIAEFTSPDGRNLLVEEVSQPKLTNVVSTDEEFVARVTDHGISYEIPANWKEVSNDAFMSETEKSKSSLPIESQELLNGAELIFAIGQTDGALANAVLTMRVVELSPADAFTQDDLKSLTDAEKSLFLNQLRSSLGAVEHQETPGLKIVGLADVSIRSTGQLLCVEQAYDTLRPDGIEASYITWNCPIGNLEINLFAHVRKDRSSEFMPTIQRVLGSLKHRG